MKAISTQSRHTSTQHNNHSRQSTGPLTRSERMTSDIRSSRIDRLIIDPRYNGPNTSGNGGWVAGSLAGLLGTESVAVCLRAPAPLAVPMRISWRDDGTVTLVNDGTLIAEAGLAPLELDVPTPPNPDEAEAAGVLAEKRARTSNERALCPLFRLRNRAQ